MIIDRIPLAGGASYFRNSLGDANLAAQTPGTARLPVAGLPAGEQWEISGIEFWLEADADLAPSFALQGSELLDVGVMKEIFPGHFADPFAHRIYNVAGVDDFKRGEFDNARIMEVDGVTTLVAIGDGACRWRSRWYELPEPTAFVAGCWELATSRLTPDDAFSYDLQIRHRDPSGQETVTPLASGAAPSDARRGAPSGLQKVAAFRVEFDGRVAHDAELYERHISVLSESGGTPLLRAVNLLEPVPSRLSFSSLAELRAACSDFEILEERNGRLLRMAGTIEVPATLVHSPRQDVAAGSYEYIELRVGSCPIKRLELRLQGESLRRVLRP